MSQASMGLENLVSETFARLGATPAVRLAEADYQTFAEALGASERGRAFLHEYARRNRHADTEVVLAALSRLEQTARAHQAEPEAERIRQDLRALLETLRGAKPQIDNSPGAIKAATLAALLEFVQARLEALISPRTTLEQVPAPEQPELPIPQPAPLPTVLSLVQAAMAAPPPRARSPLDVVEAESNVTALKAEAAVQERLNSVIPEVSFFDNAAAPSKNDTPIFDAVIADAPKPAVEPYELWLDPGLADLLTPEQKPAQPTTARPTTAQPTTVLAALAATFIKVEEVAPAPARAAATITPPPVLYQAAQTSVATAIKPAAKTTALKMDDPLALIMALSESERLALFT